MKKGIKKSVEKNKEENTLRDSQILYQYPVDETRSRSVVSREFNYHDFKKIADQAPFILKDWAGFLHTSERTLHRYAKENTAFNGLQVERLLLFKTLIKAGNQLFGRENFGTWLDRKIFSLQFKTPRELLYTHQGVQEVIDIMGRIEHGIVA